jgi:hypothetical protein
MTGRLHVTVVDTTERRQPCIIAAWAPGSLVTGWRVGIAVPPVEQTSSVHVYEIHLYWESETREAVDVDVRQTVRPEYPEGQPVAGWFRAPLAPGQDTCLAFALYAISNALYTHELDLVIRRSA